MLKDVRMEHYKVLHVNSLYKSTLNEKVFPHYLVLFCTKYLLYLHSSLQTDTKTYMVMTR